MVALGVGHGIGDSRKAMGALTLGLMPLVRHGGGGIRGWVVSACLGAVCLGPSIGGWRQMRRLGARIYRLRPLIGLGALAAGSVVIFSAAVAGGPISTTP